MYQAMQLKVGWLIALFTGSAIAATNDVHARPRGVTSSFARPAPLPEWSRGNALRVSQANTFPDQFGRRLKGETRSVIEQVHVGLNGPGEAIIVFATWTKITESAVYYGLEGQDLAQKTRGSVSTYTGLYCLTNGNRMKSPNMGDGRITDDMLKEIVDTSDVVPPDSDSYKYVQNGDDVWSELRHGCVRYKNPKAYYQSPYLHTVILRNLSPYSRYHYQPAGANRTFTFLTPPAAGQSNPEKPFRIGVWSDVGTTAVSYATMRHLAKMEPDVAILAGDLSYADGWFPKWDTFGIMMEPLMANVAHLTVVGNHEMADGREQGISWLRRYPSPHRSSGSPSPLFHSFDMGLAHVLSLAGSYAPTGADSAQYAFAARDLDRVNRTRTPWLLVQFHTPWYNSNEKHYQEGYKHQQDMEHLFYQHGVDIVFNGHVHSYERTFPVYAGEPEPCGPTHIVIGDAGNYEGPAQPWMDPQPRWSAFREASFGAGMLSIFNDTHARFEWQRTACVTRVGDTLFGGGRFEMPNGSGANTRPAQPNEDCVTSGDNSAQSRIAQDDVFIIRDTWACPSRRIGTGPGLVPELVPAELPDTKNISMIRRLADAEFDHQVDVEVEEAPVQLPTRKRTSQHSPYMRPPPSMPVSHADVIERMAEWWREDRTKTWNYSEAWRKLTDVSNEVVQQVHIGFGGPGEAVVTYLTHSPGISTRVFYHKVGDEVMLEAVGEVLTYTMRVCPTGHGLQNPGMGNEPLSPQELANIVDTSSILPETSASYKHIADANMAWASLSQGCVAYKNPLGYHQSPYIHTVVLSGLQPRTRYEYSPEGSLRRFTFRTPPSSGDESSEISGPLRIGVWGDVGVTEVSLAVSKQLRSASPDFLLLVGDYSYADGWDPRWDTFGVMMEPLMSGVLTAGVPGNHDIAEGGYNGLPWMYRYPVPYREAGSDSAFYYSFDSGLVHVLSIIGSYAPSERGSPQYDFVVNDLARVNRSKTPWIVVQFHTPWYSSNSHHQWEATVNKRNFERVFFDGGVDIVLNGHVHSYERSHPVFDDVVDECGIVHIVIGDGGNYEGPALPWSEPQPDWSAFRESSFGSGVLTVHNETHAEWIWSRGACAVSTHEGNGPAMHRFKPLIERANCSTTGDNSVQSSMPADHVILLKRNVASCASRTANFIREFPGHVSSWTKYKYVVWSGMLFFFPLSVFLIGIRWKKRKKRNPLRKHSVRSLSESDDSSEDSG